jgi:hypothetical protein
VCSDRSQAVTIAIDTAVAVIVAWRTLPDEDVSAAGLRHLADARYGTR